MQEGIVALCLVLAFGYIVYTYIRKIRHKGGGCCGCGKDCCSSRAAQCGAEGATGKIASSPHRPSQEKERSGI